MKNKRLKIRGFTLIEMVTTIGIISILAVMGLPAFARFNQDNAPKMAAEDIKSYLLEAQSLAQSPMIDNNGADYYYVSLSSAGDLRLDKGYFSGNERMNLGGDPIREMTIDPNAKILSITPSDPNDPNGGITYYFKVPSGEILFNSDRVAKGISVIKIISSAEGVVSDQSVIVDAAGGSIKNVNYLANEHAE